MTASAWVMESSLTPWECARPGTERVSAGAGRVNWGELESDSGEVEPPDAAAVGRGVDVAVRAGRQVVHRDVRQAGAEVEPLGVRALRLAGGVDARVRGEGQLTIAQHQGVGRDVRQV